MFFWGMVAPIELLAKGSSKPRYVSFYVYTGVFTETVYQKMGCSNNFSLINCRYSTMSMSSFFKIIFVKLLFTVFLYFTQYLHNFCVGIVVFTRYITHTIRIHVSHSFPPGICPLLDADFFQIYLEQLVTSSSLQFCESSLHLFRELLTLFLISVGHQTRWGFLVLHLKKLSFY